MIEIREFNMALKTRPYDSARYLKTEEDLALYMDEALRDSDPKRIAQALGVIARARGMSQLARDTGLQREGLYKSLSEDGNPELATLLKVMKALGLRLSAVPAEADTP